MCSEPNLLTKIWSHQSILIFIVAFGKELRPFEKIACDEYFDYLIYAIFDTDMSTAWIFRRRINNELSSWKFCDWRWRCIRFDWFVYNLQDDSKKKLSLKIVLLSWRCHPFVFVQTTAFSGHWLAGFYTPFFLSKLGEANFHVIEMSFSFSWHVNLLHQIFSCIVYLSILLVEKCSFLCWHSPHHTNKPCPAWPIWWKATVNNKISLFSFFFVQMLFISTNGRTINFYSWFCQSAKKKQ